MSFANSLAILASNVVGLWKSWLIFSPPRSPIILGVGFAVLHERLLNIGRPSRDLVEVSEALSSVTRGQKGIGVLHWNRYIVPDAWARIG